MAVLALTAGPLRRPPLAAAAILLLAAWTAWLTLARPTSRLAERKPAARWPLLAADLALAASLNVLAGLVMPERTVGERPFFAAGYPVAAAVSWGAARGVRAGVIAGLALGVSLAAGQLANGVERAARLAERESLARQIHDSVLQALALVHKRGRELAAQVAGLAEMAAGQERALRALVLRDPDDGPTGA